MFPQLWVLTFEPSDFKHFKAENISMFFLQNEFLCRFVILSFTKGFHSQHMSCTILRTHSLCVNGVSDILRFFNIWQGHPKCLYSMKHDSAFMTSVTFIHILQMSFKLAVVQTSLRFTLVPLLLTALVWGNPTDPRMSPISNTPQTVGLTSNTLNSDPNLTISLGVGKWVPHSNLLKNRKWGNSRSIQSIMDGHCPRFKKCLR